MCNAITYMPGLVRGGQFVTIPPFSFHYCQNNLMEITEEAQFSNIKYNNETKRSDEQTKLTRQKNLSMHGVSTSWCN
jgi:hypothetical protein